MDFSILNLLITAFTMIIPDGVRFTLSVIANCPATWIVIGLWGLEKLNDMLLSFRNLSRG